MLKSILSVQSMLFLAIIFTHFTVLNVGFSFTVLFIILPFLLLRLESKIRIKKIYVIIMLFLLLYPFFVSAMYDIFFQHVNYIEFIKTYLLYTYSIVMLFLVISSESIKLKAVDYLKVLQLIQYVLILLGILQIFGLIFLDNPFFFNPFGPFQYLYEYDYTKMVRASLFYLEPSFAAFVTFSIFNARLILEKKLKKSNILVTTFLLLLIGSSTGLIVSIFMITMIFYKFENKVFFKNSYIRILFSIFIVSIIFLFGYLNMELIIDKLRLSTFGIEGTSAFWRWIMPLYIIRDMINSYNIFGISFGQLESIVSSYQIYMGGRIGTSVDNGLFLVIIYFGLIGFIGLGIAIYTLSKSDRTNYIIILGAILSLLFNGAIFYVDYIFYGLIITILAKKARSS